LHLLLINRDRSRNTFFLNLYNAHHAATERDWDFFYRCYANTYRAHHSSPYLTREFFLRIAREMPANVLLVLGEHDGRPHCAALNLCNASTLWGRYWGTTGFVSGLHFETCYYQALEHCMNRVRGDAKKLLELRYQEGRSPEDIAKSLGRTAVAIRVSLHRVRTALRDCVERRLGLPRLANESGGA